MARFGKAMTRFGKAIQIYQSIWQSHAKFDQGYKVMQNYSQIIHAV